MGEGRKLAFTRYCHDQYAKRTPRPCSVCGSPRLCRRRERRLIGARFSRWREERFGRARCLTLRYSLLLSVWVDPSAGHSKGGPGVGARQATERCCSAPSLTASCNRGRRKLAFTRYGYISMERYWSSLFRHCPRDSVFVGCRSSSTCNFCIPWPRRELD